LDPKDRAELIAFVREARPHLAPAGPSTEEWLTRLEERHDGLASLVEDLLAADPETAAELAGVLWTFWWLRGHMVEGRRLLERAVLIAGPYHVEVLKGLGTVAFRQGDLEAANQAFQQRLELITAGGDRRALADAFADLARVALRRGDFDRVREYAERGYAAAEGLEPQAVRAPLHMQAAAARMQGRLSEARALYLRSREINAELGNHLSVAAEDHNLFYVALHSGDREEAERRFHAASAWIFANDNAYLKPYTLLDAGVLALHDGDRERACRLIAAANRIFEDTESIPDPDDRVELDTAVDRLKSDLKDRFGSLWADGRTLSLEQARKLARA